MNIPVDNPGLPHQKRRRRQTHSLCLKRWISCWKPAGCSRLPMCMGFTWTARATRRLSLSLCRWAKFKKQFKAIFFCFVFFKSFFSDKFSNHWRGHYDASSEIDWGLNARAKVGTVFYVNWCFWSNTAIESAQWTSHQVIKLFA